MGKLFPPCVYKNYRGRKTQRTENELYALNCLHFKPSPSRSVEAAALLPIFPRSIQSKYPVIWWGQPPDDQRVVLLLPTLPPPYRRHRGLGCFEAVMGQLNSQQHTVCVWPPLSFSLFCTLDQMRSQMWCGCDLAKMPMMCCLLFFSNVLVKQMMLIALM